MYISKKYKTIVLQPAIPETILAAIPGAVRSEKDSSKVLIHHTVENVQILRNLGYKRMSSPVLYEYKWPGRHTPYRHQLATTSFLTASKKGFVFNGIGAGKTHSALWASDYLMTKGLVRKVLIISPLSTLERVWMDTIFVDFFHRKAAVLHGSAKRRMDLFMDPQYDFYIINPDGFGIISQAFKERKDVNNVILDEAAGYRNISTTRFKLMRSCLKANPPDFLWMMTGTPTPSAPTDAWGQAALMGTTNGATYTGFKDLTMLKVGMFKLIPRAGCEEHVQRILSPAVRYRTEDCIDLPPTVYQTREVELSRDQARMYKEMLNQFSVEVGGGYVNAVNEADKQNKLLQILCGFIYGHDESTRIEAGPRLKIVTELLEEIDGKIIIYVPYIELISILREEIEKHATIEVVTGETSKNRRNDIFSAFQNDAAPRVLLAHPKTMAHGLTLTAAATILWYAPYPSNEIYEQANGRIVRPSQTRTTNIIHVEGTTLERKIYSRLKDRQALQGSLLELIQKKEM